MGVHGLWRLIEPSGKPVPIETLENKVLAVDVSIWLHQAIKGFQDSKGASVPNAHLLGIYHRVCKLLYFRIRPVFIFDGGVPALKKETIAKRNNLKSKNLSETYSLQKQLLNTLLKHSAVNKVISEKAMANMEDCIQKSPEKTKGGDDIYKLPLESSTESQSEDEEQYQKVRHWDLHTIDEKSTQFKSLPADVRHEILTELKETRKQSSWGRIHELPTQSDDFSIYQMNRLLKRHSVQVSLEETEKEMGGHTLSLGELEALLSDHGVITSNDKIGGRIASSENTRYLLIKDVRKALEEAAGRVQNEEMESKPEEDGAVESTEAKESEYESDLRRAIQLSLQDLPSTSKIDDSQFKMQRKIGEKEAVLDEAESSAENLQIAESCEDNLRTKQKIGGDKAMLDKAESSAEIVEIDKSCKDNFTAKVVLDEALSSAENIQISERCEDNFRTKQKFGGHKVVLDEGESSVENVQIDEGHKDNFSLAEKKSNQNICTVYDACDSFASTSSKKVQENDSSTKETHIEVMSDSDSDATDNFIEIEEQDAPIDKNPLEIVIRPKEDLEDDLFADVFTDASSSLSQVEEKSSESIAGISPATIGPVIRKSVDKEEMELEIITPAEEVGDSRDQATSSNKTVAPPLTVEQLREMKGDLLKEQNKLITERSGKERLANSITDQMYQDAQELLQLFGVPYIVAPMEAEAQCAFLDQIDLTDGTITDDSDIWLFGGSTVYKNFFNQSKHVMEFSSENIQQFFKLSRHEMILLALLVGSDYTTGVQGVGPVTALEILAAFPVKKKEDTLNNYHIVSGLQEFQRWFKQGKVAGPGRATLRNKLKNIALGDNFPSLHVVQAYLEPKVETSRENFTWGKPNLTALVEFAREKFGWSKTKSEEILKPVLKRVEENATQTKITSYFKLKHKIASGEAETKMSKRVKSAVDRMGKGEGLSSDEDVKALKQVKKRSRKKVKQIEEEIQTEMDKVKVAQEKVAVKAKAFTNLHKREKIPQREQDKANLLRSKMRAIETFRKSKQGPGYVKKRQSVARALKEDAELSESSSSD